MSKKGAILKIKSFVGKLMQKCRRKQIDTVELHLPGLNIKLSRNLALDTPHEVTVVVPRAEMRKICPGPNNGSCEYELIYSSITVVHAPRHPLAGPSASLSEEGPEAFSN